jgi:DNA-directed RNA polymerase specialized sigma24 family protein
MNIRNEGSSMAKNTAIGEKSAKRLLPRAQRRRHVIVMAEVDDPYFSPSHAESRTNTRKTMAFRNANESPLTLMEARGTITLLQAEAGLRFRILFERLMAGTPSPGDIKERVDGGGRADGMSESRMDAGRQLRDAATSLGREKYWIVRTICGEGRSLREVAKMAGVRRDTVKAGLGAGLNDLAEIWNMANTRQLGTLSARAPYAQSR